MNPGWGEPAQGSAMKLDLQTEGLRAAEVRRTIVAHLKREATVDSDFGAAELIVGELLANVVKYAPGPFHIELFWERGSAIFEIRDYGQGFAFPRPQPTPDQPGGHGLHLAAKLARELIVRRVDDRGNLVRAVLPVTRA